MINSFGKGKTYTFICLVIIFVIFVFIKPSFGIKGQITRGLNSNEINKVITENNIDHLNIQTIYNFDTIIIYGDLYKRGYYEAYISKDDKISVKKVNGTGYWKNPKSIELDGGRTSGNYPFQIMYIFDDDFSSKCNEIHVVGSKSNFKIKSANKSAYAIETKYLGEITNIIAYNSNGEIIFKYYD